MQQFVCKRCNKEYKSKNYNQKHCSMNCRVLASRGPIDIDVLRELRKRGWSQSKISKQFKVSQAAISHAIKKHKIPARKIVNKYGSGESSSAWKGDNVTNRSFATRVRKILGNARKCVICDKDKNCCWANLTDNHSDISDYLSLCKSCISSKFFKSYKKTNPTNSLLKLRFWYSLYKYLNVQPK